jgi:hypothetical protein
MAVQAISTYAALIFAFASGGVILFQIALVLGAPWGEFTLGGRWKGRLPIRVRLIPLLSIALLVFFCVVVLARADFLGRASWALVPWLIWLVVAYCLLGCIVNAITPSRLERMLWLPVVASMLATSVIVALS